MRSSRNLTSLACMSIVVGLLALTGCGGGSDSNLVHVSGTVTVDGKPLPLGLIVFEPDPMRNRGPQGFANIKDGRFDTCQAGKAVALGPQIVRITGGDGVKAEAFSPFGNLLFDEHMVQLEVSQGQPPLNLDIPSQKAKNRP